MSQYITLEKSHFCGKKSFTFCKPCPRQKKLT